MSAYGDHLAASGYYDPSPEQERELTSSEIVSRIWEAFGRPSYEEMAGRSLFDLVDAAVKDAERYRFLRDHCSSHYPMTHEQPAEWSIGWEFQQSTPVEAYGSFDKWIDADIQEHRKANDA